MDILNDIVLRIVGARKILDVGGGWGAYEHATHILDLEPGPLDCGENQGIDFSSKVWVQGDACRPSTWDVFSNKQFDFCVCSHTLEDVYDPFTIIEQMSRVSKAGYAEVPSAFAETMKFMHPDEFQPVINGYLHHHWIFELDESDHDSIGLIATPKRPELLIPDLTEMTGQCANWRSLSFTGVLWYGQLKFSINYDIKKAKEHLIGMRKVWEDPEYMMNYSPVVFHSKFVRKYIDREDI